MLNTISEFLLKDSLPLQIGLHSIPGVNVIVRLVQNRCSLDTFRQKTFGHLSSPALVQDYTTRKARFDTSIKSAILIQTVIAITAFALCILLPGSSVLALICLGFGMGALTSYLLDLFMKNFRSSLIATNGYGQLVHIDGF